ncbi:uncharacterized protein LOC143348740 [Colletes latitarsis]|uniref:uncharacterized protein LOC143348740 n=1 Tax=Colletes latitarsis TaxID=2605962 RepID=UPI00403635CF
MENESASTPETGVSSPGFDIAFERILQLGELATANLKPEGDDQPAPTTSGGVQPPLLFPVGRQMITVPAHIPTTTRRYKCPVPGGRYVLRWAKDGSLKSCLYREDQSTEVNTTAAAVPAAAPTSAAAPVAATTTTAAKGETARKRRNRHRKPSAAEGSANPRVQRPETRRERRRRRPGNPNRAPNNDLPMKAIQAVLTSLQMMQGRNTAGPSKHSMPEEFNAVITAIETMNSREVNLEFVKARLLDEELKLRSKTTNERGNNDEVSFKAFPFACYKCGKVGHKISDCNVKDKLNFNKNSRNIHRGRGYFRGRGYRPKRPETASQANKDEIAFVALSSKIDDIESGYTKFILDFGASVHLVKESMERYMCGVEALGKEVTIIIANGEKMKAVKHDDFVGTYRGQNIRIRALIVGGLDHNLLSMRKLAQNNYKVTFNNRGVEITDETNCLYCERENNLYILRLKNIRESVYEGRKADVSKKAELWHRRMGHLNRKGMRILGLPTNDDKCSTCVEERKVTEGIENCDKQPGQREKEASEEESEEEENKGARPKRIVKRPEWHTEYEMYMTYCLLTQKEDPPTFEEAVKNKEWRHAIQDEVTALENQNTWEMSTLPKGKTAIETRWVFRTKENGRRKARLVAKGFQVKESEYQNSYAPVARLSTIRMLLSKAVQENLSIKQLDIPTAFLNGDLEPEVYIKVPKGLASEGVETLKLRKALFVIYIDDILISGDSSEVVEALMSKFKAKNMGEVRNFLGMEITRLGSSLFISQEKMIDKVLNKFRMEDCRTANTPMEVNFQIDKDSKEINVPFRELIGSVMYLATTSRPDLM